MYERDVGERLVAAAKPRFKDFRVDFEKISTAASRASREGRDGLEPATAANWFFDVDWHLRIPLQRHYADHGAFEAVAHYHAKRFKDLFGGKDPWPDAPAEDALRLFAEHGRPAVGVDLVRTIIDIQLKRLRKDLSKRNPRGPRKDLSDGVKQVIGAIDKAIDDGIPDRKRELMRDLEAVEPYIAAHGGDDDRAWLDSVRREIWMERRA